MTGQRDSLLSTYTRGIPQMGQLMPQQHTRPRTFRIGGRIMHDRKVEIARPVCRFPIVASLAQVLSATRISCVIALCLLLITSQMALPAEPNVPSKEILSRQYSQIVSEVRNCEIQFVNRDVGNNSPNGPQQVIIRCGVLFTHGDDAQIRLSWSNADRSDWKTGCDFQKLGDAPTASTTGADRVVCFRSEDASTAEFMNYSPPGKPTYTILMAVYQSERPLGAFHLPYVAAKRKWNYRDEFACSGRSLVDEFFGFGLDLWSEPRRDVLEGQDRWRVDVSLTGGRARLKVGPQYGKLEGEDYLSAWFETKSPYRLRTITSDRRFFYEGVEVPIEFTGAKWWVRRADLSGYDSSPSGFTFPIEGRQTMASANQPSQSFDEVAAAYLDKGVLTKSSEHYLSNDCTWVVKQIKHIESNEGLWIQPVAGTLVHNVDAGTEILAGKTKFETALILGYIPSANWRNPANIKAVFYGSIEVGLIVIGIAVLAVILRRHVKRVRNSSLQ